MPNVTVHHGDSRDVLGNRLNGRISAPVTWPTEHDQVHKVVRLAMVREEAKRPNVVNVGADAATMLADAFIAFPGFSLLRRPVRAAMMRRPPLVLRVQLPHAVSVPTVASAIEASPDSNAAGWTHKARPASDARHGMHERRSRRHGRVLARSRTRLSATVPCARRWNEERRPTSLAGKFNLGPHSAILSGAA